MVVDTTIDEGESLLDAVLRTALKANALFKAGCRGYVVRCNKCTQPLCTVTFGHEICYPEHRCEI